jgi:dTDP-4-dehydrorhamnose reductase
MNGSSHDVVIIGNKGMLGRCFEPILHARGITCHGFDLPELDMTNREQTLAKLHEIGPAVVINCAAYTDVDGAEEHEELALRLNGEGPAILAAGCRDIGATLVHYSTDYVFNGEATAPYPVDSAIEPLNAYGRTKAAGEEAIRASGCQHLILRSSWLYAAHGKNFVITIANLAKDRPELKVVSDQRGRPTSCPVLADTTLRLLDCGARGTYHATDGGEATWHEFASQIAAAANPDCRVLPCTSDEFPRPAKRPAYSTLDISLTEELLGPLPRWELSLLDVLRCLGYTAATPTN